MESAIPRVQSNGMIAAIGIADGHCDSWETRIDRDRSAQPHSPVWKAGQ
jgi:hypothetical protein